MDECIGEIIAVGIEMDVETPEDLGFSFYVVTAHLLVRSLFAIKKKNARLARLVDIRQANGRSSVQTQIELNLSLGFLISLSLQV